MNNEEKEQVLARGRRLAEELRQLQGGEFVNYLTELLDAHKRTDWNSLPIEQDLAKISFNKGQGHFCEHILNLINNAKEELQKSEEKNTLK